MSKELDISKTVLDELPSSLKQALAKLSRIQQLNFEEDYKRRRKSKGAYLALAIFFPIQHFLLGKTGIGIVFWLTFWGVWVWYVIEWFYTPLTRVPLFNEDLARSLIRDTRVMNAD